MEVYRNLPTDGIRFSLSESEKILKDFRTTVQGMGKIAVRKICSGLDSGFESDGSDSSVSSSSETYSSDTSSTTSSDSSEMDLWEGTSAPPPGGEGDAGN